MVEKEPYLLFLSMSYIPSITDMSVQTLVGAFPNSITDLGFVGCESGDESGLTLLRKIQTSKNLCLICIEENNFLAALKDKFLALRKKSRHSVLWYKTLDKQELFISYF